MQHYRSAKGFRDYVVENARRFRGGKLQPVSAVPYKQSEGSLLSVEGIVYADNVAGRLKSKIRGDVVSVFVPALAMDELKNPQEAGAGNTEFFRDKLLSGTAPFGLEPEGVLSKAMRVNPRSIGGVKKVNEVVRLGHNCAVNFLRRRKYVDAAQLLAEHDGITPALLSRTALDKLNGVLNPDSRINGQVDLELGAIKIPVRGIGVADSAADYSSYGKLRETGGVVTDNTNNDSSIRSSEDPNNPGFPDIYADLDGYDTGSVSLQDFYNAERVDRLVRTFRAMVDSNPEHGEHMVSRYVHGLEVDNAKQPIVLYRREFDLSAGETRDVSGANFGDIQTILAVPVSFTVPVPKTEFGGMVMTFVTVKPDETFDSQPDPFLSEPWGAINFAVDEFAIDPVPVYIRDLYSDCDQSDEDTLAMYIGNNHLKREYHSYGFSRDTDETDVAEKTAIWQIGIPMSVTPETVIYPEYIDHYPFPVHGTEADPKDCFEFYFKTTARVATPMFMGPLPVEELAIIETDDLFEEED